MTEGKPELDPQIDQREDGVVIEPGSEIDQDLNRNAAEGKPDSPGQRT
ncbi:hypothetical protein [Arthrobacter mangrovi]|nr:hypothetical protein [Arthrobacter mangrovi]